MRLGDAFLRDGELIPRHAECVVTAAPLRSQACEALD